MTTTVPLKSIDIGRHGIGYRDTDGFASFASFSAPASAVCVTDCYDFINILPTFFNVYTEQWKRWNSYTPHDLKYIIVHVHIWIRMSVLRFLHTSANIYFLSPTNCIYSNLLQYALFLCTRFFCSVLYVGISAWNLYLYMYKNIRMGLCVIEVVCYNTDVSSIPAWSMYDSLWPRDCSFSPPKCLIFIIYQCFILEFF